MQTVVGTIALALIGGVAVNLVLPGPQPIVVHSLTYSDGVVHQERTITTEQPAFFAAWTAQIVDAATGLPVPHCNGSGSWPYPAGYRVADIPLAEWVGNPLCTPESLDPTKQYRPVAAWYWGEDQTSHSGQPFKP